MNEEPVTLAEMQTHLRPAISTEEEDAYIQGLIVAARRVVERKIGRRAVGDDLEVDEDDRPLVQQAMKLIVASWYVNREALGALPLKELPLGVGYLLEPLERLGLR